MFTIKQIETGEWIVRRPNGKQWGSPYKTKAVAQKHADFENSRDIY